MDPIIKAELLHPSLILFWTALPCLALIFAVKVIAPLFLEHRFDKNNKSLMLDVCQRFVRANFAMILAVGGIRSLLFAQWNTPNDVLHNTSPVARFYLAGVVYFYIYDSIVLILFRNKDWTLYMHHFTAMLLWGLCLIDGLLHYYLTIILMFEFLVPFGFCLFFFKNQNPPQTSSLPFLLVSIGGFVVIVLVREPLTWYLIISLLPVMHQIYLEANIFLTLLFGFSCFIGPVLDFKWARLYYKNITNCLSQQNTLKNSIDPIVSKKKKKKNVRQAIDRILAKS